MPRKGKSLEQLVASIEKAIGINKNVKVESPKSLTDRTTGRKREHDVVITIKQGHHNLIVAIECRDRSRPVTVNQIEGFWAKCQDTGIDKGIIVSSMGFYNTARIKADHHGIRCLDIEEVDSFNWLKTSGTYLITKKLIKHDWIFYPEEEGVVENSNIEVLDKNGNPVNQAILTSNAQIQLSKLTPDRPEPVEDKELNVKFEGDGLILRNTETGMTTPVKHTIAKLRYSVTEEFIPFQLIKYSDKDSDNNITDAAIAKLDYGEKTAKLVVVYKEGEGGKVIYEPDE